MEISSYVTSAAMAMSQVRTGQVVSLALVEKAMDTQQVQMEGLVELIGSSTSPTAGLDLRV